MPATLTHNEMLSQPKVASLMRWIDSHDRPALTRFVVETGMLIVSSIEIVNGVATEVAETIPATLAAARDLLGY
ncbi:hypothetical protein [Cupriavidus oxalaticus]|uniref:hypothetical protein n=1 Tax=Cupriavidus oxalaticus TaxID=96344 RepID=UPI0031818F70